MSLKKYFKSKKIIYSAKLSPAELVKMFSHKGVRYVRVAFTNRVKFKGTLPITDIKRSDLTGIRKLPSPFKQDLYKLFGKTPRATYYELKKNKN